MGFFMLLLAIDATHSRRVGEQALEADFLAAVTANAIFPCLDVFAHRLDCTHFVDLAIHPREHDLVIGTHGRSAFVIDLLPVRAAAKKQ